MKLDVTDGEAVDAAVSEAFASAGTIDVIVNNAGYGLLGALEKATDSEARRLFEVDLFAPFRIIRAALPHLRAQGSGHIINITSIAGRAPGPGSALYSAAKYALEGLSASLAQEVRPFGVKVTAVAPGAFRTDFLSNHSIRKSEGEDAAYAAQRRPHDVRIRRNGRQADRRSGSSARRRFSNWCGANSRRSIFFWERTRCVARVRKSTRLSRRWIDGKM